MVEAKRTAEKAEDEQKRRDQRVTKIQGDINNLKANDKRLTVRVGDMRKEIQNNNDDIQGLRREFGDLVCTKLFKKCVFIFEFCTNVVFV